MKTILISILMSLSLVSCATTTKYRQGQLLVVKEGYYVNCILKVTKGVCIQHQHNLVENQLLGVSCKGVIQYDLEKTCEDNSDKAPEVRGVTQDYLEEFTK